MGGKHDVPNTLFLVKKRDFLGLWYKESLGYYKITSEIMKGVAILF